LNPDPQISQHGKNFIPFNDKNFYGDRERKIERERERERERNVYTTKMNLACGNRHAKKKSLI
jgi:hypothetical protein